MKLVLVVAPLLCVPLVSSQGLFDGITNTFNNLFGSGRPNRQPARPPARRPPQFQQSFSQPSFSSQSSQPSFQSQPSFSSQSSFNSAPSFSSQPSSSFNSQPSSFSSGSSFSSQSVQSQAAPQFRPAATSAPATSSRLVGGTSLCGSAAPNHFWTDPRDNIRRGYVATWKVGCSTFQQHEAKEYCESMGMEPVSLDTPAKQDNFNRLIAQDAQRYFWTGGEVDHRNEQVCWNNKNARCLKFKESAHWSHTGGADLPQPDNRAAGENPPHPEVCLGILNNFYADGIKWHDVACHHKKPTICEPRS